MTDAFHRPYSSGRQTAHGRKPAATAAFLVGEEDPVGHVASLGDRPQRARAVQPAVDLGPAVPADRPGCRAQVRPAVRTPSSRYCLSAADLEVEQQPLGRQATPVAAQGAVGAEHAVTGHDHRNRVGGAGGADRADRSRVPGGGRDLGVALGPAVVDVSQVPEHVAPVAGGQPEVQGQVEGPSPPGEVLLELSRCRIEPRRAAQDPRADPVGETPPAPGRAPSDAKAMRTTPLGWRRPGVSRAGSPPCGRPGPAARRGRPRRRAGARSCSRSAVSSAVIGRVMAMSFRGGDRSARSFLIPSAAARRTASAVPPISSAVSAYGSPPR